MYGFKWDPDKDAKNIADHGVDFIEASTVFTDSGRTSKEDTKAEGEQRFVTVGFSNKARLLTVCYAYRDEIFRIISARRATGKESKVYEEGV